MQNKWASGTMLYELERLSDLAKDKHTDLPTEVKYNLLFHKALDEKHKENQEVFILDPTAIELLKLKKRKQETKYNDRKTTPNKIKSIKRHGT